MMSMPDRAAVRLFEQGPVRVSSCAPGVVLADFGRVAFGNVLLYPPSGVRARVVVHFGESLAGGRVNRHPPGSVRYARVEVQLTGEDSIVIAPPPDARNTEHPAAVCTPEEWGAILPFRWVEVEGWPGSFDSSFIARRAAFSATWDDEAASFECSDPMLNRIWELCRYSIKATTFAGVYVDGDRERIAYEGDAYLNQINHYACDHDTHMARETFERLLRFPTWPTEWALHMIFMAHADWMHTGDRDWLFGHYEALKPKLLLDRAREDGLLVSNAAQMEKGDLVDWPAGERDGFVFTPVNTVVNAFHARALRMMSELAAVVVRHDESAAFAVRADMVIRAMREKLFDAEAGLFRDGEATGHISAHANLFPLAFGLVADAEAAPIARWLSMLGMVCSVYAAQYLLEGLFRHGCAREALALMTAPGDRSWRHMVESGATITWEAWDHRYKPNQDWNHAWGAAPANLLPRFVLGLQPLEPGWSRVRVRPCPGSLAWARGRIPTPRGPVEVEWKAGGSPSLHVRLPAGVSAQREWPE